MNQADLSVHLYSTWTTVESRGSPGYSAIAINLDMDRQCHMKYSVITANRKFSVTLDSFFFFKNGSQKLAHFQKGQTILLHFDIFIHPDRILQNEYVLKHRYKNQV